MSELVVIAGMSGAGRSQAADNLEDLGFFVVDNLPPSLIPKIAELIEGAAGRYDRMALVVGSAGGGEESLPLVGELRHQVERFKVLFLDASTDVLVRRYEQTRRRHPFAGDVSGTLTELIEAERSALEPLREEADVTLDTSDLNVHQLRDRMREMFGGDGDDGPVMRTTLMSFGYKHGMPRDVDIVLDCRFLPNPHWVEELRPLTGQDTPVADYVLEQPVTGAFIVRLERLLALLMPFYVEEGKSYLTIAFGCTGGRHRSVAIAERMAGVLESLGHGPAVVHRDVDK